MAITRSAWMQAQGNQQLMDSLITFSAMEAGQQRIDSWLHETGLMRKCRIGVVAVWNNFTSEQLDARAKVIVDGVGSFEHMEMYSTFPSEHFKTKVLLVTGGV